MRFRLRTLLILLAVGPPVLAMLWFYFTAIRLALVVAMIGVIAITGGLIVSVIIDSSLGHIRWFNDRK